LKTGPFQEGCKKSKLHYGIHFVEKLQSIISIPIPKLPLHAFMKFLGFVILVAVRYAAENPRRILQSDAPGVSDVQDWPRQQI